MTYSIKDWPADERPREKLLRQGAESLSNSELLAIVIRTGTRGEPATSLARKILLSFSSFRALNSVPEKDWRKIKGMGIAKIVQIKAALEIGRRMLEEEVQSKKQKISSSHDAASYCMHRMRDLKKEVFRLLLLDSQNHLIDTVEIEKGTVNCAYPIVREIFSAAIEKYASAVICAHNHPSGNPEPSIEDTGFTRQLCGAGEIMQIAVLDHIIIGDNRYYSFADAGLLLKT
ncbi:MAG: DNA repair protein RadC [Candidatus Omnitrophica bacterium]|nr:DNA repair protein RadC [Candidatus Omnitrophota bacterium]